MRLLLSAQSFARSYGLPETRLINLLNEATPDGSFQSPLAPPQGIREVRFSRPGVVSSLNPGAGPIRGIFASPGVFGGAIFVASGQSLYSGSTYLGSLPGSDAVRFAASRSQLVILSGQVPYLWNGTTLAPINSSVLPPISEIAILGQRFLYNVAGSDTFYWSEVNDAANIDGLSFATAETSADPSTAFQVVGDQVYILGGSTIEVWGLAALNSDGTGTPFAPQEGAGYARGCASRDAVRAVDNTVFWIGEDRTGYRGEAVPKRITTHLIEDKLRQAADVTKVTAWTGTVEGHELYALTIPNIGTWVYDVSQDKWSEWQSFGRPHFRGRFAASLAGAIYVGDDVTNDVGQLTVGVFTDYGGPMARIVSAYQPVEEGRPRCDNVVLHMVHGVGVSSGLGVAPQVEMRSSDDDGRTFGKWRPAPIGAEGVYKPRAIWRRLGLMQAPGRLFEWRVTDPVNAVFSHAEINVKRVA